MAVGERSLISSSAASDGTKRQDKGSRKCNASMSVPTELEDIIHEYMKKRQRVDIYVSYGKGINPNARKINGQLLKVDESDTQTDFINF